MNERKARALIEKHFVEPLPPRKFRKLWEHLSSCQACRTHYDRLAAFEQAVDGGRAEVERIGESLFERVELRERKPLFAGGFQFTWPFPTVIAGAAAAVALMVLTRPPAPGGGFHEPEAPVGQFAERGGPEAQISEDPELLAACFLDRGKGPEAPKNLTASGPLRTCPRGGRMALAYRRARPGDQLFVFAVQDGEASQLVPAPGLAAPALVPGPGTTALHGSFAIEQDAPAGEVSLVAVFGQAPDPERLQSALARGEDLAQAAGDQAIVQRLGYRLEPLP